MTEEEARLINFDNDVESLGDPGATEIFIKEHQEETDKLLKDIPDNYPKDLTIEEAIGELGRGNAILRTCRNSIHISLKVSRTEKQAKA